MFIKTIINLIELYFISKFILKAGRFFFLGKRYGKNKKGKSITGKIGLLMSNNIHNVLDTMIKAQKAKRAAVVEEPQAREVTFKIYKGQKAN